MQRKEIRVNAGGRNLLISANSWNGAKKNRCELHNDLRVNGVPLPFRKEALTAPICTENLPAIASTCSEVEAHYFAAYSFVCRLRE